MTKFPFFTERETNHFCKYHEQHQSKTFSSESPNTYLQYQKGHEWISGAHSFDLNPGAPLDCTDHTLGGSDNVKDPSMPSVPKIGI